MSDTTVWSRAVDGSRGREEPRGARGPAGPGRGRGRSIRSSRTPHALAAASVAVLVAVGAPGPAASQQLPDGVTAEMVERGRQLFRGDGFCYTCHGRDASGMSGAGGDLTDREWRHTDGSFEGIAERIRQGVKANASTVGVPMPPAGGADLTPEQIRALAAYVWTLSREGG